MYLLHRTETDPYYNLAAEEYFLKHGPGDMFMLWQNRPAVVIGKHQNAYAEVNYRFLKEQGIMLVRRISGGGAVYHDPGNVNFTFIQTIGNRNQVDFLRYLKPVITLLEHFGIRAEAGKRNDLLINGYKFSGNAEHVFRDKVIHHGTILFDTNLDHLEKSLDAPREKYHGKALPSVRSRVTNLRPLISQALSCDDFMEGLIQQFCLHFPGTVFYTRTADDNENIDELIKNRYRTRQWNFGYSPAYSFVLDTGNIQLDVQVKNGKIISAIPLPNDAGDHGIQFPEDFFTGLEHHEEAVAEFASEHSAELANLGISPDELVSAFF
jgi:lipoate-protein ligase A